MNEQQVKNEKGKNAEHTQEVSEKLLITDEGQKSSKEGCGAFRHEDIEELKKNVSDLTEKIKKATQEEMPELKKSLLKVLGSGKENSFCSHMPVSQTLKHIGCTAEEKIKQLGEKGGSCIAHGPWKSIAAAGLIGVMVGLLLTKESK